MGFDEYLSLDAAKQYPKDLNQAINYIRTHSTKQLLESAQAMTEFKLPVFITIKASENDPLKFEEYKESFTITASLWSKTRVIDVLDAFITRFNETMSPTEYQIMNPLPAEKMKSFCDITSTEEQLKYLNQFNKHDIMTKGLHLYCAVKESSIELNTELNTLEENISIKKKVIMDLGYKEDLAEVALTKVEGNLAKAIKLILDAEEKLNKENESKNEAIIPPMTDFSEFQIPVFINIPNADDSREPYIVYDQHFSISYDLWIETNGVSSLLTATMWWLNKKRKPEEYQLIMPPTADMISKSFCNITLHDDLCKPLYKFNTSDMIMKGLHILCYRKITKSAQDIKIQKVMAAGYDRMVAYVALRVAGGDIQKAIEMAGDATSKCEAKRQENKVEEAKTEEDDTCKANIEKCQSIKSLAQQMAVYNNDWKCLKEMNTDQYTKVLNDFHHILQYHDINDMAYDYVFNQFGQCELECCNTIRRYYSNRFVDNDNSGDVYTAFIKQLFERIHSHICHGYDLFRFNKAERKQLEQLMLANDDANEEDENTKSYLKLSASILQQKASHFNDVVHTSRFTRGKNKFNSTMEQSILFHYMNDTKNESKIHKAFQGVLPSYSFSYPFNYWRKCKDSAQRCHSGYVREYYVAPKYESFKEELLNNEISCIDLHKWYIKELNAEQQKKTKQFRFTFANWVVGTHYKDDHSSHYGYERGAPMEIQHLMAVMIYCSEDEFQAKFSETYRKLSSDETLQQIKERHSNFHHFAKALKEVVEVFGVVYGHSTSAADRFYHGINTEMVFYGTKSQIYSVMSTTIKIAVAQIFAQNDGLIVEMIPSPALKYFDVRWLSEYSNEEEYLFIGGKAAMNFMNIIHTSHHFHLKKYITALRIIDSMFDGEYFTYDPAVCRKVFGGHSVELDLSKLDTNREIEPTIKTITSRLIEHETHRYKPGQYKEYENLNGYIDKLLHNVCFHKSNIFIDIQAMNVVSLKEFNLAGNGYIGYLFFKHYICNKPYESVDLDFITMLFPSVKWITIQNLSSANSAFLNQMLHLLSLQKTSLETIELRIQSKLGWSNILEQFNAYQSQFAEIGYRTQTLTRTEGKCLIVFATQSFQPITKRKSFEY